MVHVAGLARPSQAKNWHPIDFDWQKDMKENYGKD
jgi:hypothetical protein